MRGVSDGGMVYRMLGPSILTRTLSVPVPIGASPVPLQYHPRSDRHSKVLCWAVVFDLLRHSSVLANQAREGTVAFGINHKMRDFRQNRAKDLDLVLCTPLTSKPKRGARTFRELAERYGIVLTEEEEQILEKLPVLRSGEVGAVRVALEAKAAMTEHGKAHSRLYDELNSSQLTIHGASEHAIAVGVVMVNVAEEFQSPGRPKLNVHRQPRDAERVIERIRELPRRSDAAERGFDALGIVTIDSTNDGVRPVTLVEGPPALPSGDIFNYRSMIHRIVHLYERRYGGD